MENKNLAIASVPIQQWERLYDENTALLNGTVFPCLNMPFYAAESAAETPLGSAISALPQSENLSSGNEQTQLLLQIMTVSFVLDDLRLYMDTHPADTAPADIKKELVTKRKQLLSQFAQNHYPLTPDCEGCWQEGPMPWEGVCC
ncbi:spore coat protein CotJB [Murimonas intestini]|uniref:Spore coat associated protein JA (CotJA) n=1 Tax=Murimonas intestini TaxID=1337051 RepID=A0AB73SXM6_9FIRM|nr:spore coat protein CotJB [Murimonas intestini]MCR1843396.1 spore coat protein CotJB [Murimonas intestini]MCR1868749.1 spore coat protein CotJB [Murimonas intestini]MCR1886282.1 spore coat protein CotJB [Murimonas intestini]